MPTKGIVIRPAATADAAHLAVLVDIAAQGLAVRMWQGLAAPGQSPLDFGRARALRETGGFSYRNAFLAEADGAVAGLLVGYPLMGGAVDLSDVPPLVRPMTELEAEVPGHWYVNVLAVYPEFRGRGIGGRLLDHADAVGRAASPVGMAIIVAASNDGARRLYRRHGYGQAGSRPSVPDPALHDPGAWLLLRKPHG
ncbi:MAG: GNAT family N-acetyltransferase [Bauldia sp.]|nr:GNAT family N-acetyltransferase [Bauldia sp.]MCW5719310.1 GNAT family N-acetyltransferase [Bauldia sp.]